MYNLTIIRCFIWILTIFTLLISCVNNQGKSRSAEKIEFTTIDYTINPTKDTTIFGPQGTRVFIGSETFQYSNGKIVKDSIRIELREFYSKADIILANLSTVSGNKLLETGGMVYIDASSNSQKLEIRQNENIIIHFPKEKYDSRSMDLFYASEKSTDTSVTNWEVDTVNLVKTTLKLGAYGWYYPEYGDSTGYDFIPKDYVDTGYYWNPLEFYIESYNFSEKTKQEVGSVMNRNDSRNFENWNDYGVECDVFISMDGYVKKPRLNTKVSESTRKEIIAFLMNLPQLTPGLNKDGDIIERRGLIFIQDGNIIPLYKTDEQYLKSFNSKYSEYENEPIKNISDVELFYYVFSVSKLGWINCDRFINDFETTNLLVNIPVDVNTELKMAFSNFNGFLKASIVDNNYIFYNIPKGEKATIVGLRNKEGQFSTVFKKITIKDNLSINNLEFKEMSLSELRDRLENI